MGAAGVAAAWLPQQALGVVDAHPAHPARSMDAARAGAAGGLPCLQGEQAAGIRWHFACGRGMGFAPSPLSPPLSCRPQLAYTTDTLRLAGLSPPLITRAIHDLREAIWAFEALRVYADYRTPCIIRAFIRFVVFLGVHPPPAPSLSLPVRMPVCVLRRPLPGQQVAKGEGG